MPRTLRPSRKGEGERHGTIKENIASAMHLTSCRKKRKREIKIPAKEKNFDTMNDASQRKMRKQEIEETIEAQNVKISDPMVNGKKRKRKTEDPAEQRNVEATNAVSQRKKRKLEETTGKKNVKISDPMANGKKRNRETGRLSREEVLVTEDVAQLRKKRRKETEMLAMKLRELVPEYRHYPKYWCDFHANGNWSFRWTEREVVNRFEFAGMDNFFSRSEKHWQGSHTDDAMSLGLSCLQNLFTLSGEQQIRHLITNRREFLGKALKERWKLTFDAMPAALKKAGFGCKLRRTQEPPKYPG